MVDNVLGAMINNVLAAKWSESEMVDKALGAKYKFPKPAWLPLTLQMFLLILDATCPAAKSALLGGDIVEDHPLIKVQIYTDI